MMTGSMTIRDIAGFCPEEAVWKMMADVSDYLLKESNDCIITPDSIVIDGNTFIMETGSEPIKEFLAPEQTDTNRSGISQMVWSIGAVAYYAATGHVVFGGHGSNYQKEHMSVALPILPKILQALTPVIQGCLCAVPEKRYSMKELHDLSLKGLASCKNQQRMKTEETKDEQKKNTIIADDKWPEEMIEL